MKGKSIFSRVLLAICVLAVVFTLTAVSAFADGAEDGDNISADGSALYEGQDKDDMAADANGISDEQTESGREKQNVFALIYQGVEEHITEILSALTVVGTMLVAFAYKKGLLPLITSAISNMQSAIGKMKDEQSKEADETKASARSMSEKLAGLENSLTVFTNELASLEEKLEDKAVAALEREKVRTIICSQIDMLYDIFMSSALPQYQKEAVGTRVQRMKEELMEYEKVAE